jgi:hypothetical protein
MPLPKVHKNIVDQQGNIVPGVLCSVYNQGTAVLASLYSDDAGTVVLSNPLTNDATYGSVKFYVNPGHFDLTFTKPGYTFESIMDFQVPEDVLTLGTMAQQNANAVAITGGAATGLTNLQATQMQIDGNTLVVDPTTHRVGIGIYTPGEVFHVATNAWMLGRLSIGSRILGTNSLEEIVWPGLTQPGLTLQIDGTDTPNQSTIAFRNSGAALIGSISQSATATSYNTTSDGRLKERIEAMTGALATLKQLLPVRFRWKGDGAPGVGFVAQDVQPLVPEAVTGTPEAPEPMGMDLSKLVPYLVSAMQDLSQRLEALEARQ